MRRARSSTTLSFSAAGIRSVRPNAPLMRKVATTNWALNLASYSLVGLTLEAAGSATIGIVSRGKYVVRRHVRNIADLDLGIFGNVRDGGHQIFAGDG